ncbi:Protein-L-isoaspartate O-methyltransferase [Operophtera brumata]|uniref:protein-L-isoaspartate(D-aspartate) O-methyltransferase n=1 Tax=Operophtera brumata TaxID=104452 RepID=A0A0L7KS73_OPEBR|nr:Protein-L-isoaspartate O-methyltransferase [Operophtera brumata]
MAWRSHGINNADLVRNLRANGIIKTDSVANAMNAVDRKNYCPYAPYHDSPQSIGYSATISAPHMHAHALERLKNQLVPGEKALDVGSGSGYLTACMAIMLGETGQVIGIEHIPDLLIEQLKPGGRMIVPVGPEGGEQHLTQVDKAQDGTTTVKKLMSVIYVPLTDKDHQYRE